MTEAKRWVEKLALEPHPEGGYFKRIYESDVLIPNTELPARFTGDRNAGSAIYYLLEKGDFSAFHRLQTDEQWHHYAGDPLTLHLLDETGYQKVVIESEHTPQWIIKHGIWMAAESQGKYSLVGCTCTPAFHFDDFEMGKRDKLINGFPEYRLIIERFTRGL